MTNHPPELPRKGAHLLWHVELVDLGLKPEQRKAVGQTPELALKHLYAMLKHNAEIGQERIDLFAAAEATTRILAERQLPARRARG